MTYQTVFNPRFWLLRLAELGTASMLIFLFTGWINEREKIRFDVIPATEWFEVLEIYVPDHEVGDQPLMVYDRVIKVDFVGFWIAEVQNRNTEKGAPVRFFAACSGSGSNTYEVGDYADPSKTDWLWFLGRPCIIPPGTYRIVVDYDMRLVGGERIKTYRAQSNVFRVYAPGTMP